MRLLNEIDASLVAVRLAVLVCATAVGSLILEGEHVPSWQLAVVVAYLLTGGPASPSVWSTGPLTPSVVVAAMCTERSGTPDQFLSELHVAPAPLAGRHVLR